MRSVEHSTNIVEERGEGLVIYGGSGIVLIAVGTVLWYFNKDGGSLLVLSYLLLAIGLGLTGFGVREALKIRKVQSLAFACPYCELSNALTAAPEDDFRC